MATITKFDKKLPPASEIAINPECLSDFTTFVYGEAGRAKNLKEVDGIRQYLDDKRVLLTNELKLNLISEQNMKRFNTKMDSAIQYCVSEIQRRCYSDKSLALTTEEKNLIDPKPISGISDSMVEKVKQYSLVPRNN